MAYPDRPAPTMLFSLLIILLQAYAVFAWDTFTVPHLPGEDDTPGLLALVTNHSSDATILFSKGITYNIFTAIKFPKLTNVEIFIEGNLTYPDNITAVQGTHPPGISILSSFKLIPRCCGSVGMHSELFQAARSVIQNFPGSWFTFSGGNNVTLRGSTDPEWGWVDAHGQAVRPFDRIILTFLSYSQFPVVGRRSTS